MLCLFVCLHVCSPGFLNLHKSAVAWSLNITLHTRSSKQSRKHNFLLLKNMPNYKLGFNLSEKTLRQLMCSLWHRHLDNIVFNCQIFKRSLVWRCCKVTAEADAGGMSSCVRVTHTNSIITTCCRDFIDVVKLHVSVTSLKLAAAAPLASCVNPRGNERKLPPEGNTAVAFCCSCCSFYSVSSSLVCLFSFVTFSTFSSRYYRSPVRVCCVRATLHHSRTNPPSLRSGFHRRPAAGDQREQPELTVIKQHVITFFKLLFLPSRQHTHGLPAACSPAAEDALSSASSAHHTASHTNNSATGCHFQNNLREQSNRKRS